MAMKINSLQVVMAVPDAHGLVEEPSIRLL
jgi:hypothetical protein